MTQPITKVSVSAITELFHIGEKLNDNNWTIWREQMQHAYKMTGLTDYIKDTITVPNQAEQPISYSNWDFNNGYARVLIIKNVDNSQLKHIMKYELAHEMWTSLVRVHEIQGFETGLTLARSFWSSTCSEDEDIEKHIDTVKDKWERLNALQTPEFTFSNSIFKGILIASLPSSWDHITDPYLSTKLSKYGAQPGDARANVSVEELIGFLKEVARTRKMAAATDQAMIAKHGSNKRGLQSRIGQRSNDTTDKKRCDNCKRKGHVRKDCWFLKPKCEKCGLYGHEVDKCQSQVDIRNNNNARKNKRNNQNDRNTSGNKKTRTTESTNAAETTNAAVEQAYIVEVPKVTRQALSAKACTLDIDSDFQIDGYDDNDDAISFYDWFADSCTTSHICNKRDAFTQYRPAVNANVIGVGNTLTEIRGRGNVKVQTRVGGITHTLTLQNVLHIPTNKYNLISLGRWDKAGREFRSSQGLLSMIDRDGKTVAYGTKLHSNLYRMHMRTARATELTGKARAVLSAKLGPPIAFPVNEARTWEEWHWRFGHIGYKGLQELKRKNLVTGFNVSPSSSKPDCRACTESKHTE